MAGFEDDKLGFSIDDVALGDLEDLEEHWGLTLQQLLKAVDGKQVESLGSKVLGAMAFLVLRQSNPNATPQEARRMKLPVFVDVLRAVQVPDGAPAVPQRLAGGARGGATQDPPAGS